MISSTLKSKRFYGKETRQTMRLLEKSSTILQDFVPQKLENLCVFIVRKLSESFKGLIENNSNE